MITTIGKQIIAKYLMGTTPSYASYIALGCGPKPINIGDVPGDYSEYNTLGFEMFRVPILSRGYLYENGVNKIVLTAELPTEERYEISEVGIYSAGANPSATSYDSKTITAFSDTEGWLLHDDVGLYSPVEYVGTSTPFDLITSPLAIDDTFVSSALAIQSNATNSAFADTIAGVTNSRAARYERSRYLNNMIMMRGNNSTLNSSFNLDSLSTYLQLDGQTIDFSRNSTLDKLKVAFSVINSGPTGSGPDNVYITVEFSNGGTSGSADHQYARMNIHAVKGTGTGEYDFSNNRYVVAEKTLGDLVFSSAFSWKNMNTIRIYSSANIGSTPTADYYIALDAIRLDNIATLNPLYGLVGYSLIQTLGAVTIVKSPNTNNYIEFRFTLDTN